MNYDVTSSSCVGAGVFILQTVSMLIEIKNEQFHTDRMHIYSGVTYMLVTIFFPVKLKCLLVK